MKLALLLYLATTPLWAQQPTMPMDHSNMHMEQPQPPQLPNPELLQGITTQPPLNLNYFLTLADAHNPTLQQAAALVRRSQAQARQAALYPNPMVGYEGDQIRGGSYGGGEQGGFVEQTIVLGGKISLRRNVYQQQQQADTLSAEAQRVRVHSEVTQMFYQAFSAQQIVEVRAHLLHLAGDATQTARRLANIGQADAPDVLQAEVEAEQAGIDYTLAQRLFIQRFKQLATLTGEPAVELARLDATLDPPPEINVADTMDLILKQSPAVRQAQQQVEVAAAKLKSAKRAVVPDLQLKAGEQQNFEQLDGIPGKKTGVQSFASAGIELPLWNRNQGNTQAAAADLDRARQEVTRTQLALRSQTEGLLQNYLSAKLEADRYRAALLPRARQAYELYLAKYQNMAQAYPQVILSQRTLFELEVHSIEAQDRAWQNAIALQNFTLEGALNPPTPSE